MGQSSKTAKISREEKYEKPPLLQNPLILLNEIMGNVRGPLHKRSGSIWGKCIRGKNVTIDSKSFFRFWGLTPKLGALATDQPGGSLAPREIYRAAKRSRRYLEKWPRYRGQKKFWLHPLAGEDEPIATDRSDSQVGGHGGYAPPKYGDRQPSNSRATGPQSFAWNPYETVWHLRASQKRLNRSRLTKLLHTTVESLEDCVTFHGKPVSKLWSITCHMRSHSVTCHPTWVNAPPVASIPIHGGCSLCPVKNTGGSFHKIADQNFPHFH